MPDIKMVEVDEASYIYNEQSCSMDPSDISQSMGIAFGAVVNFMAGNGITSAGKPLSVYHTYDENKMTFRAGFLVSADDAKKAQGDVRADVLPAGNVLNYIHKGSYSTLRESYGELMKYVEDNGLTIGAPSWEVYLNEPDTVDSEDDLETDVYVPFERA